MSGKNRITFVKIIRSIKYSLFEVSDHLGGDVGTHTDYISYIYYGGSSRRSQTHRSLFRLFSEIFLFLVFFLVYNT